MSVDPQLIEGGRAQSPNRSIHSHPKWTSLCASSGYAWERTSSRTRTSEVRSTLRARSRSVLCAEDAACLLVEIGGAGYCRSEYYFLLYSALTSPANQPGLSLSEVSVSNAERMGKRSSDLAVSNLLQISATSSSSPRELR